MDSIWKLVIPLGLFAFMVGYSKIAARMGIPRPVYWTTMIACGFLVMSVFDLW